MGRFTVFSERKMQVFLLKQIWITALYRIFHLISLQSLTPITLLWWEWGFFLFIIVGSANATNLTDGLDGLLTGSAIISFSGFWFYLANQSEPSLVLLNQVLIICCAVFLTLNRFPAKIFMGDTGSLAIGAACAGFAIVSQNPWILIPLGAIYILETLSAPKFHFINGKKTVFFNGTTSSSFRTHGLSERRVVGLLGNGYRFKHHLFCTIIIL